MVETGYLEGGHKYFSTDIPLPNQIFLYRRLRTCLMVITWSSVWKLQSVIMTVIKTLSKFPGYQTEIHIPSSMGTNIKLERQKNN